MNGIFKLLCHVHLSYKLRSGTPERGCITGALPPLPFERCGNGGTGAFTYQHHKQFHDLSRSMWSKPIAAIRAHLKFRMVFYTFCYWFWGQYCC